MLLIDALTQEVVIDRGDDQTIRFIVTDSSGAVLNVAAGSFRFTVKASPDDAQAAALFSLTSPAASGIDLAQASSGIVDVNLAAANTSALGGQYFYDLEMTLSGKLTTLRSGVFNVRKDVSTPPQPPPPSPILEALFYESLFFAGILQDGDILTQDLALARSINIEIRHAHVDAESGPSGAAGRIRFQDHPTVPTQTSDLVVTNTSGARAAQEFDAVAATMTSFLLNVAGGKKLTVKVITGSGMEKGHVHFGWRYVV